MCQVAAEGHTVLSPAAARRLIVASADRQPARDRARHLAGSLTRPQAQVLACLGEGLSNAQIAARLYLSEARVKGYVSRMLDRLGCANRAQAVCRARTRTITLSWCFLCLSGCSPVLADQAVDDVPVPDPGGHIDRLAGLVQRRSLFPRLVRPMLVVATRGRTW